MTSHTRTSERAKRVLRHDLQRWHHIQRSMRERSLRHYFKRFGIGRVEDCTPMDDLGHTARYIHHDGCPVVHQMHHAHGHPQKPTIGACKGFTPKNIHQL
jgi:hypothetical protein